MSTTVSPGKTSLDTDEIILLLEGLDSAEREWNRMALDAYRLGYVHEATLMRQKATQYAALSDLATGVTITKITVRHS